MIFSEHTYSFFSFSLESCFFRCNSCGFDRSPEEEDPLLEQHARYDVSCPVIQDDIKAQFIDIKSRKREVFRNVSMSLKRLQIYSILISMRIFRFCRTYLAS